MTYMIKGVVETLSSDGKFRIRGAEGYSLEKDDKTYNVFWEASGNASKIKESGELNLVACPQKDGEEERKFQLLASARANHQKVELEVELKSATVTKVTLL